VLLVFGGVAVLVGAFTIVNTLSITVAQRSRELALLRALGAHRRQVRRSVVGEALLIGAGRLGDRRGGGLRPGRRRHRAVRQDGPRPAQADAAFSATTVVVGLGVGTLVTVLASLRPARRATKVAPVSILREGAAHAGAPGRLGRGVRAVLGLVGRPAQAAGGTAGKLARMNAMRAPGRTLATASALTIGVSLVVAVAVIGHGLKSSAIDSEKDRIAADYVLSGADGWSPVDSAAVEAVGGATGVETVSAVRKDEAQAFGERATVAGIDPRTFPKVLTSRWEDGSAAAFSSLGDDGAVVRSDFAKRNGLAVGSPFSVTSRSGEKLSLVVRAIERKPHTDVLGLGQVLVAGRAFDRVFKADRAALTFVNVAGGASAQAEKTLAASIDRFPDAKIMTPAEYVELSSGFVDDLLAVFYVLLALAVIVSLFGIVNTLVLSIFERTRELGMLRAIGMTRRQVRRMIRHESIITAMLGAVAGIVVGLGLAAIVTTVFADEGFAFVVPAGSLVDFLAVAIVAGISRRHSRPVAPPASTRWAPSPTSEARARSAALAPGGEGRETEALRRANPTCRWAELPSTAGP
jgi:putative ABC transport system permease protein